MITMSSIASSFPLGVEELLKKFRDVFPQRPPSWVAPLRGIEHQVDLMSGVSIPNRPHIEVIRKRQKRAKDKLRALWKKGWVRESLSPCSMPVVLVNQTLSPLLRCLVGKNLKAWEECLPHAKFAYNRIVNSTTSYFLFEVVYGFNPLIPFNLLSLPNTSTMMNRDGLSNANFVKSLHEKLKAQIEKKVEQYARHANKGRKNMVFKPGDGFGFT